MALSFDGKVVIVTGAGGGLGKAYANLLASRGASVVVNDFSKIAADAAVDEIKKGGKGKAVANYDSVDQGQKIVEQAIKEWGRIDVLINNAGILRDKSFSKMTDAEWDQIYDVHVKGAYACTKAAWPYMRKQKFGRILMTSSAAGVYGNFGQANYAAAKFGLVGFMRTLAKEGVKYNITCSAIAPSAASAMTATILPPEHLAKMGPEKVAPFVAYLLHADTKETGDVWECGSNWFGKLRFERSQGVVFRTDQTFTPSAVKRRWDEVLDFKNPDHPEGLASTDMAGLLNKSKTLPSNTQSVPVHYQGQTVLITGAGAGLGRAYALMYAKGGANVVVNDMSQEVADKVVAEIKKAGGKAVAAIGSTEDGEALVKAAVDAFGGLHILVANAGILRDVSFLKMTDAQWDIIYKVHLRGTYAVCRAAYPIFQKQKYGRIVTTCSAVGIYGNFGQANYSMAKSAIIGLSRTLAIEGKKYNILVNCIAPNAGTQLTSTVWTDDMVKAFSPAYVAPIVGYLTCSANETTGGLFEVSGGWVAAHRWQQSYGHTWPIDYQVTPEDIKGKWTEITRFDEKAANPTAISGAVARSYANMGLTRNAAPRK